MLCLFICTISQKKTHEKRFGGTVSKKNKTERAPCIRQQAMALYGRGAVRNGFPTHRFMIVLAASLRNKSPQFATTVCPQVVKNLFSTT